MEIGKIIKSLEPSLLDTLKGKLSFYKERVESIVKWGWRGRNLQVWEHTSLLRVMQYHMKDMESATRTYGQHVGSIKQANRILWAIGLIDRVLKDDYCKKEYERLYKYRDDNDPNPDHLMSFTTKSDHEHGTCYTRSETPEAHKYHRTFHRIYQEEERQRAADLTQMFAILDKRAQSWWY